MSENTFTTIHHEDGSRTVTYEDGSFVTYAPPSPYALTVRALLADMRR